MNIFIDIETIPAQPEQENLQAFIDEIKPPATMKKQETIDAWMNGEGKYAGERESLALDKYLKTSFDGARGEVCSISYAVGFGKPVVMFQSDESSEYDVLNIFNNHLFNALERENGRLPYFIGHYISGFDLKFLFHRMVINNIEPKFKIPFIGRHGSDYYDTMIAWCGYKDKISQDNLCRALGIEGKPDGVDGSKVYSMFKECKYIDIANYNVDDVKKVQAIYKKLNFLGEK